MTGPKTPTTPASNKNWQCRGEIHEELFGVWEEDTEGDILFDQNIKWKDSTLFEIHATIHNRSKDEIIRKWTREKTEFFVTNLLDQGESTKKWTMPIRNWGIILNQFLTIFENRIKL